MAKEEKMLTLYKVEPYSFRRGNGDPVVASVEVIEKPKTYVRADGFNFGSEFGYGVRLEKSRLGSHFFTSREEAIAEFVKNRASMERNARERANDAAREFIEALEWATREGVFVEGCSTPDVPDPAMRKPSGLDAAVDREKARAIAELADELGERAEEIDERLGALAASVVKAAAEIDRILDEREAKA
jgi:hypothetical protein